MVFIEKVSCFFTFQNKIIVVQSCNMKQIAKLFFRQSNSFKFKILFMIFLR